jgi:glycolate oxidase iron-sulfur subunit
MTESPASRTNPPPLCDDAAFDVLRPPPADVLADCVHCGFCLPACPTYQLWGEEMDSPRGRIQLMELGRQGRVSMNDTLVGHMDACLGCMACVTACPSGVRYQSLIEATRAQIERRYDRSRADRWFRAAIFALFPRPGRLRVALVGAWLYQRLGLRALARRAGALGRLPARLRTVEALLPPVRLRQLLGRGQPAHTPAVGQARRRVGLLTGCVQRVLFADVNAATARVLAAEGCDVVAPPEQGCCGALMVHAGWEEPARARARALIDAFDAAGVDTVVTNAAGCGSTMKEYGHLLADDPDYADRAAALAARTRDITELLTELEPRAPRHPVDVRVAYQDACHLRHAQGVARQPRDVLAGLPGVELVELAEPDLCCGSAGIYNLVQPEPAEELGARKAGHVTATHPDVLVSANPGCAMQLRRHLDGAVPVAHPVQLVDAAIRGVPVPGAAS